METTETKPDLIQHYYSLLKNLNRNSKLELIAKLSHSMKSSKEVKDDSWKSLFGALELDETSETFIDGLEKDRNFTNKNFDL
jgi:hypothetical protein